MPAWRNRDPAGDGLWVPYTPTMTSTYAGAGSSSSGRWSQVGTTVNFYAQIALGTGFTLSSYTGISLPVPAVAASAYGVDIDVKFLDSGYAGFKGAGLLFAGAINPYYTTTNGIMLALSATAPFTWAAGDSIIVAGTYERA